MMPKLDLRVLVLEKRPFQLIDLERLLNQCGCFNLTPAIDARDLELLVEQGRQFDLLVCKESSLNSAEHLKERDLLEVLVASGYVSQLMLITDSSQKKTSRQAELKEAIWPSSRSLFRSCSVSVAPPLTPERIRPYLLPQLLKFAKSDMRAYG